VVKRWSKGGLKYEEKILYLVESTEDSDSDSDGSILPSHRWVPAAKLHARLESSLIELASPP
jgi:hypothetical protein